MNDEQLLRYSRQIMLDDFDYGGQQKLVDAKVLIVGLGGLGCPAALYLAGAGIGELWLADFDVVDLSNLQRQIAHAMSDIDRPKVISVSESVAAINPDTMSQCIGEKLTGKLLLDAVEKVDVVVDCSDNVKTRLEINRACVDLKTPLVSGAAIRAEGQVIVFDSREESSPCYQCLYKDTTAVENLSCAESGVLSPLVGVIGSMQAIEVIKLLSGFGKPVAGQLQIYDAKMSEWRKLLLPKSPACPVCG
ncbi:MAG: molybdopterin-synthase adenylyltransferase MoeB [Oceanicoccus sp.]